MRIQLYLVLTIFLFVTSCSHVPKDNASEKSELSSQRLPSRVIDSHTHFKGSTAWVPDDKMEAEFLSNNVSGAIVHASIEDPIPSKKVEDFKGTRLAVCAAVIPKANIAPYEKAIKEGRVQCLKVYLGYIPRYPYDAVYDVYYRLAEHHQIPVVFHTGDTYDKMAKVKYADPLAIDEIAVTYPKVKFVIAHLGNPWIQSAAEVVYKNDNVYADLSALMIDDLSKSSSESHNELIVKPIRWAWLYVEDPKKLMFGTDYPLTAIGPYLKLIAQAVPEEHWDDIFYGNAARVFGFDKFDHSIGTQPLALK